MRKLLIPIFHGHIARNILRTEVLNFLKKGAKVVLVVPDFKVNSYREEFGDESVVIESAPPIKFTKLDKQFRNLYHYFVDTNTVRITQGQQFWITKKYLKYFFSRVFTKVVGNSKIIRGLIRFFDLWFVKDTLFGEIFDKHNPDLVFIPSLTSDDEGLVLRQARVRGIKTVGMIRSWDNITVNKGNIRVYPDKLIVHGNILKDDVVRYADMSEEKIEVVGMSHFDYYVTGKRIDRIEFFTKFGGSPSLKTIYFMPIGLSDQNQDRKMLAFFENVVRTDFRFKDTQLMISSHPNTDKKIDYADPKTVVVSFSGISYPGGKLTDREITMSDMEIMASAIYHSEVIVNYQGTTSLDAAAFDKPIINIAFDEIENKPYLQSIRRFYDFDHYQPILKSGGVRVASSQKELVDLMAMYLNHPEYDEEAREKMLLEQDGGFVLGGACERTAKAILATS